MEKKQNKTQVFLRNGQVSTADNVLITSENVENFKFDVSKINLTEDGFTDRNLEILYRIGAKLPVSIFAGTRNGSSSNTFFCCYKLQGRIYCHKMMDVSSNLLRLFKTTRNDYNKLKHVFNYSFISVRKSFYSNEDKKNFKRKLFKEFSENYSFNFNFSKRLSLSNDSYHGGNRSFSQLYDTNDRTLSAELEVVYTKMDNLDVVLNRKKNRESFNQLWKVESDGSLRGTFAFEFKNLQYGSYKNFLRDSKSMLQVCFSEEITNPTTSNSGLHFHIGNFKNEFERHAFAQIVNQLINSLSEKELIEIFGRDFNQYCPQTTTPTKNTRNAVYVTPYGTVEIRLFHGVIDYDDFLQKYKTVCKLIDKTNKILKTINL